MKKVLTYGTFDLFHIGHYNILKRARKQGDYLIVGVTSNSYDIERGKLSVKDDLATRIDNVKRTGFADEIIIEEYTGQKINDIIKHNVDVLVVGDDWRGKFDHLSNYCKVVYLKRTKNISSTQIRDKNANILNFGIALDEIEEDDITKEIQQVSGFHTQSIYNSDIEKAKKYRDRFEIDSFHSNFDDFLNSIDIVYINVTFEKRFELCKKSIEAGKHVVCKYPFVFNEEQAKELYALAKNKNVIFVEDIVTIYLRAFTQLMWIIQANEIGKIICVKAAITSENSNSYIDLLALCSCVIFKLLGCNFSKIYSSLADSGNGGYINLNIIFPETITTMGIGLGIDIGNNLTIYGDKGTIVLRDDWWNTAYFEVIKTASKKVKKYCFNFAGTGLRYTFNDVITALTNNIVDSSRLALDESLAILKVINSFLQYEFINDNSSFDKNKL